MEALASWNKYMPKFDVGSKLGLHNMRFNGSNIDFCGSWWLIVWKKEKKKLLFCYPCWNLFETSYKNCIFGLLKKNTYIIKNHHLIFPMSRHKVTKSPNAKRLFVVCLEKWIGQIYYLTRSFRFLNKEPERLCRKRTWEELISS